MFTNLSEYSIQWVLLENGTEVFKSEFRSMDVKPGSEENLYLPEINRYISDDKEYIIEFSVKTKKPSPWVEANFEIAWEQIVLTPYPYLSTNESKSDVELTEKDELLVIRTAHSKIIFDQKNGVLESVLKNDGTILFEDLSNAFWRAPIDNDISIARKWRQAGLDSMLSGLEKVDVKKENTYVDILVEKEHRAPGKDCGFYSKEIFRIYGDGSIRLETEISPFGALPESLPRIGYELKVPEEYSRVTWYGKGFGDSYPDRSEGMKTGIFSGEVDALFINYPMPQENGNRSNVRWMNIANIKEEGIKVHGDGPLNFSVRKFTTSNLTEAKHPYDLVKQAYSILNIDAEQGPIGNKSCGPEALEKYWLKPDKKNFTLYLNWQY